MKPTATEPAPQTQFLLPDLATMLDARQPLYRLAQTIDWTQFESAFAKLYKDEGRPALPIRRLVGLLLLKQLHNLSDERVVEQWTLNPYFQFFCGEREFQWGAPCAASELVHFRDRIGPGGAEKLLAASIALHGERAKEKEVVLDALNMLLAATAANLSLWLRRASACLHAILVRLILAARLRPFLYRPIFQTGFKGTTSQM